MAKKVFKEKLAQMQSWPFFVVAFKEGSTWLCVNLHTTVFL